MRELQHRRITLQPIELGGWYEHDDGSVGRYLWLNGQPKCVQVVASWADQSLAETSAADLDSAAMQNA
jgi:hypothetical protein